MISTKFLIFISCLTIISVQSTSGQWTESVVTEFRGGGLQGMGGRCLDRELLPVRKYEDFVTVFEKPAGANEYFATSSEGIDEYCIENSGTFTGDIDYEVLVLIYTNGGPDLIRLSVIDINNGDVLTTDVGTDVSKVWTTSTIKLTRKSSYKIRLECIKSNDDAFFAIDKIVLRIPIPTEATSIDTTEGTTATEAPPIETTETTTVTEVPSTDTTTHSTVTEAPSTDTTTDSTVTEAPSTDTTTHSTVTEAPSTDTTTHSTVTEAPSTDTTTHSTVTEAPSTDTTTHSTVTEAPSTDITEATTATKPPSTDTTEATLPTEAPPASPCNCICNCNFFCKAKTIFP